MASAAQRYGNCIDGRTDAATWIHGTIEMTESILELHAFLEDGEKRKPLHIKVSVPAKSQGQQDYFCLVHAPLVLGQDRRIFGVDPDQARSLAVGFIKSLLENKNVVDGEGKPVSL